MPKNNQENNLDIFFKMIDSVEDDISKMLEDKSDESGEYGCLVICFNFLRLYCGQVGIEFSQIEDQYSSFKESETDDTFWNFDIGINLKNGNEIKRFGRVLEEMENGLAAFERRCKKTEESFDEWNCVFIMYSYLRKYCYETKTSYTELMSDVSKIQSDLEKNGGPELEA